MEKEVSNMWPPVSAPLLRHLQWQTCSPSSPTFFNVIWVSCQTGCAQNAWEGTTTKFRHRPVNTPPSYASNPKFDSDLKTCHLNGIDKKLTRYWEPSFSVQRSTCVCRTQAVLRFRVKITEKIVVSVKKWTEISEIWRGPLNPLIKRNFSSWHFFKLIISLIFWANVAFLGFKNIMWWKKECFTKAQQHLTNIMKHKNTHYSLQSGGTQRFISTAKGRFLSLATICETFL